MNKTQFEIYTDGSCRGNGKELAEGGFGVVLYCEANDSVIAHGFRSNNTTNNREEMKAILYALDMIYDYYENEPTAKNAEFVIYSDSAYCVNMINDWIHSWATNNWRRSKNQPIENLDLVKQIYAYLQRPNFGLWKIEKIAGHDGIWGNELADACATENQKKFKKLCEEYPNFDITNNIWYNILY